VTYVTVNVKDSVDIAARDLLDQAIVRSVARMGECRRNPHVTVLHQPILDVVLVKKAKENS
jgi:hypothetical protein